MSQNDKLIQAAGEIIEAINHLLQTRNRIYIAIDGRCGAGKSTLAEALRKELDCDVVHMDDFFLRPEQRTKERLSKPGENVDHERFLKEVLLPYREGKEFTYCPYDCHTQSLKEPEKVIPGKILVVEGAYSCRMSLWDFYDIHIFLDVEPDIQLERIKERNGEKAVERFEDLWIPLEEAYFQQSKVQEKCDLIFQI